jgi:hypothetical protein
MSAVFDSADRLEIHELTARYAWSLDTGDEDAFVDRFCRAGARVWEACETEGRWRGAAALRGDIGYPRQRPESAGRQHHVSNLNVTPTAEGATAKCYVAVTLRADPGPHLLNVMGYYEDVLRNEEGRWRFATRHIRDWSGPVLGRFAGQQGVRMARPLPPPLAGLWETRSGQS